MQANQWIQLVLLGGVAGAIGQIARTLVGLKKLGEEATALGRSRSQLIEPSRLVISVVIGFTAGALAAMLAKVDLTNVPLEQMLAFAGAGYAGADFIEGALTSVAPAVRSAPPPDARATPARLPDGATADVGDEYLG